MASWQRCWNDSSTMNETSDFDGDEKSIDAKTPSGVIPFDIEKPPISTGMIRKLRNIFVKIKHEVPQQHKIGKSCCSSPLTKDEKFKFQRYVEIKEGKFGKDEDQTLKNNWENFCAVHKIEVNGDHFFEKRYNNILFIKNDVERKKFVQFLANGLANRSLYSVFKRFERIYGRNTQDEAKNRPYTDKEDEIIQEHFNNKKPGVMLSVTLPELLKRPFDSIEGRYQQLRKKAEERESTRNKEWSLDLIEQIVKNLLDITQKNNIKELKDEVISQDVWKKLGGEVKVNWNSLRYFWLHELHMQLFCPDRISLNVIKIKLIKYLHSAGITVLSDIDWKMAVKEFDGCTSHFLSDIFHSLKNLKCDDEYYDRKKLSHEDKRLSIGKYIEGLYKKHIKVIQKEKLDSYLPRFSFEDNKLKQIDCISYNG